MSYGSGVDGVDGAGKLYSPKPSLRWDAPRFAPASTVSTTPGTSATAAAAHYALLRELLLDPLMPGAQGQHWAGVDTVTTALERGVIPLTRRSHHTG